MPAMRTYYERNKDRLKLSQKNRNEVKRAAGRRKVSKHQRKNTENAARLAQEGSPRVYHTAIVYASRERDPERTPEMEEAEQELLDKLSDLEVAARQEGADSDWVGLYVEKLRPLLSDQLEIARAAMDEVCMDLARRGQFIHGHRRLVAIIHQDIELLGQGQDASRMASEDRATVMGGCRINKIVFRRLFGF
ncbi:hypothetical protein BV25DRAFT_1916343 [Artomyces pyxidatus]|uniref:Uncharacterized protein n=1 Tax=Artomyces pyxidatus TaxID=48021 RepID=A0ACB8T1Q6_9AGAM|nr:hypothetical protein BV25DRAFT_1916343 [Artomyces pyxidatus]